MATKNELIAAIREIDSSKTVTALKKENVADLTMLLEELQAPVKEKVLPFREREDVREKIDSLKESRTKLFQPAVYGRDKEKLEEALTAMLKDISEIADAAGVSV